MVDSVTPSGEKTNKNQQFRTSDFFAVLGSLLAVMAVIGPILKNHVESEAKIAATHQARVFAQELVARVENRSRKIANVSESFQLEGVLGRDPWGENYSYKVLRNVYGQPTHVLVWSKGPNMKVDTEERALLKNIDEGQSDFDFSGDDLGSIVALSHASNKN